MPDKSSTSEPRSERAQIISTMAMIASLWVASDLGYYFLLPRLGVAPSYNVGAIAISLYYAFWAGVTVIAFWPQYATWLRNANRPISIVVWTFSFSSTVLFAAYIVPNLPPLNLPGGFAPPELPVATAWYFLPKSVDILFQQLLVIALVLSLSVAHLGLRSISISCAALFGGAHLLLAFGDVPWAYVARFATLAAAFGLIFPYLILRVPNGAAYSYLTHWVYYALTVVLVRTLGPGTGLNALKRLLDWS